MYCVEEISTEVSMLTSEPRQSRLCASSVNTGNMLPPICFEYELNRWLILTNCTFKIHINYSTNMARLYGWLVRICYCCWLICARTVSNHTGAQNDNSFIHCFFCIVFVSVSIFKANKFWGNLMTRINLVANMVLLLVHWFLWCLPAICQIPLQYIWNNVFWFIQIASYCYLLSRCLRTCTHKLQVEPVRLNGRKQKHNHNYYLVKDAAICILVSWWYKWWMI